MVIIYYVFINELNGKLLKYVDADSVTISVGVNGYAQIPDANIPSGHIFLFATVRSWSSSGEKVFSIAGAGRNFYVIAPQNTTVTNLRLRFFWCD